jgi:hypothetical protein
VKKQHKPFQLVVEDAVEMGTHENFYAALKKYLKS